MGHNAARAAGLLRPVQPVDDRRYEESLAGLVGMSKSGMSGSHVYAIMDCIKEKIMLWSVMARI